MGRPWCWACRGRDERDRYDRLIAYIDTTDGVDTGLTLIGDGLAIARYDPRDGYGSHPASRRTTPRRRPATPGTAAPHRHPWSRRRPPSRRSQQRSRRRCRAPGYQDGPYQNCGAVRAAGAAPITADNPWFESKFDRDGDGVGCES